MITFLDANALIYLIEGAEPFATHVKTELRRVTRTHHDTRLAMSTLSRLECRTGPLKSGDAGLLADYDEFFSQPRLTLIPLSDSVIDLATAIRARHGVKTPDALQAASCLQLGPEHLFVTGDRGFLRVDGLRTRIL